VIVNTCGFLGAARDESVGVISDVLAARPDGQKIIAAGCMPALRDYSNDIPAGVDHVLTTLEWFKIGDVVSTLFDLPIAPEVAGCEGMLTTFHRHQTGPSAYVKVADGCDHNCAFCTIPTIKGRQISKPPLHVLQEIVDLVAHGAKEVVLVAQDTIRYGADLGIKHGLPMLLESIAEQVPNLPWVRLLYIYPTVLTLRMVDVIAEHEALLPYLDMPLQHADRDVLRAMNRPSDPDMTRRLIDHARAAGFRVNTPDRDDERAGAVIIDVPDGHAVTQELIRREVIVDYRPDAGIRMSPHFYNTADEIDHAMATLQQIVGSGATGVR